MMLNCKNNKEKGTVMKTNREKNQEHVARQEDKVRPAKKCYDFEPLQAVINQWVRL